MVPQGKTRIGDPGSYLSCGKWPMTLLFPAYCAKYVSWPRSNGKPGKYKGANADLINKTVAATARGLNVTALRDGGL